MNLIVQVMVFLSLILLNAKVLAQNIVPNASFEDLYGPAPCWTSGTREDFSNHVKEWITPNMGTSDLLNTQVSPYCLTAMPYSTASPVNYFPRGSQMPRTGNTFAGIKPLYDSRREYLEVKLACPLVPGEAYYAEMYVSLSENTNYAQNSLGMYFSDSLVYTDTYDRLDFTPQIVEDEVLDDTINWVKISGTFTATSPAKYLIIGSFASQENTELKYLGNKGEIDFPYYFIDDVLVRRVSTPPVSITGDTVVCKGDTVHLSASGWPSVSWLVPSGNTVLVNNQDLLFIATQNVTVTAQSIQCKQKLKKDVQIVIAPDPVLSLGEDTLICPGTSVTLDAGPGLDNYDWSTGSASQTTTVSFPGVYTVLAENSEGCKGKDDIQIDYYESPQADLGSDFKTCSPEGVLDAWSGRDYETFLWQDLSSSPQYSYTSEGVYWVTITNVCGEQDSDTISISKIAPFFPNLVTPNDDGMNDLLRILDIEEGKGKLSIFNRYGRQVYRNEQYQNDFSGKDLGDGIYYYHFIYPACPDVKGWLQIIR